MCLWTIGRRNKDGSEVRYRTVAGNKVRVDPCTMRDRFVICRNPEQAERDSAVRDRPIAQLADAIADSAERAKLAARLCAKRPLRRFLRATAGRLVRVARAAGRAEAHLDGEFLLRSSAPTLSAEDSALGYKQLLRLDRGWRDMKTTLDPRPVHHRKQDRIRAHVQLCWLALLLLPIRIAENQTGDTWRNLRRELQRRHQGSFRGTAGLITAAQLQILRDLGLDPPPSFPALSLAA